MEKAYDLKVLIVKLKGRGLDLAEESAKILIEEVLDFIHESAIASENKFDDLVSSLIPLVKPHILASVDKIDGEVG